MPVWLGLRSRKIFGAWSRSRKIWDPWSQSRKNYTESNFNFDNSHFLNQISHSNGRIDQRKHVLNGIAPHLNVQKHLITWARVGVGVIKFRNPGVGVGVVKFRVSGVSVTFFCSDSAALCITHCYSHYVYKRIWNYGHQHIWQPLPRFEQNLWENTFLIHYVLKKNILIIGW